MKTFLARQAIFDRNNKTVAYELLYRKSEKNVFPVDIPEDEATSNLLINTFLDMDIEDFSDNKPVLINFSEGVLKQCFADMLPVDNVVIEILETIKPTIEILNIVKELFNKGYRLALDDFEYSEEWSPFLEYVHLVKIDLIHTSLEDTPSIIKLLKSKNPNLKILAEKIETEEEYIKATIQGFDFFQGFYFCKPEMLEGDSIPISPEMLNKAYEEVKSSNVDYDKLSIYICNDVSIAYKFLKFINIELSGNIDNITSIRKAISLIDKNRIIKFFSLFVYAKYGDRTIPNQVEKAKMRGYFCKNIALKSDSYLSSDKFFIVGYFSVLDGVFDNDFKHMISKLPFDNDIKNALIKGTGLCSHVLSLVEEYEKENWDNVSVLREHLHIENDILIHDCYNESILNIKEEVLALSF